MFLQPDGGIVIGDIRERLSDPPSPAIALDDGALQKPSALHARRLTPHTTKPTPRHDLRVAPQIRSSAPNIATPHGAIRSSSVGPLEPRRSQTLCGIRGDGTLTTSSVVISSQLPLRWISSCGEDATEGHVMVGGFSIPTTNHADCSRNTRTTLKRLKIRSPEMAGRVFA